MDKPTNSTLNFEALKDNIRKEITQPAIAQFNQRLLAYLHWLVDQQVPFTRLFRLIPVEERVHLFKLFFVFPERLGQ